MASRAGGAYPGDMTASRRVLPSHIVARLRAIAAPASCWESDGGLPTTDHACAMALAALEQLAAAVPWSVERVFITPSHDGGIHLQWMTDERGLIVTVPPAKGQPFTIFQSRSQPPSEEEWHTVDLSCLPALLQGLVEPGKNQPGSALVDLAADERHWDEQFASGAKVLSAMAEQAKADYDSGQTLPLDARE